MDIQPLGERNIPPQIYELAAISRAGAPLKRQKRRFVQIFLVGELLFGIVLLGWICYNIYGYIAFIILSQTYPTVTSVPDNQLENYLWLQGLHDNFWLDTLQIAAPFLSLIGSSFPLFTAYRTKLYLCTDGLLQVTRKKDEKVSLGLAEWYIGGR